MLYRVTVVYPVQDNIDEMIEQQILAAVGRSSDGSGLGFGERDIEWDNLPKKEARKLRRKIEALSIDGLRVYVDEEVPYEDEEFDAE